MPFSLILLQSQTDEKKKEIEKLNFMVQKKKRNDMHRRIAFKIVSQYGIVGDEFLQEVGYKRSFQAKVVSASAIVYPVVRKGFCEQFKSFLSRSNLIEKIKEKDEFYAENIQSLATTAFKSNLEYKDIAFFDF